jgi:sulfatase modifying factor 1
VRGVVRLTDACEWLLSGDDAGDDPAELLRVARELADSGELRLAATAYDRAYRAAAGDSAAEDSAAEDSEVARARAALLDRLAVTEHGMTFRYVPAGTFRMGSDHGDPDERPVHSVRLDEYWIAATPVSWESFCKLIGWLPPPEGRPAESEDASELDIFMTNRIRLQYCEDLTTRAVDWHAHYRSKWTRGGEEIDSRDVFGEPPRSDPTASWRYETKPMVSVSWADAEAFGQRLSTPEVRYCLATEAEWERAARGGLAGRRYPWGDDPPTPQLCDFSRFDEFSMKPMRTYPPNGYGLYGMAGSVWEWTADRYDAQYYRGSPAHNPAGPDTGMHRVLRGGSWADCAEAVTVSFRMSRPAVDERVGGPAWCMTPNVGFRLCRKARTITR